MSSTSTSFTSASSHVQSSNKKSNEQVSKENTNKQNVTVEKSIRPSSARQTVANVGTSDSCKTTLAGNIENPSPTFTPYERPDSEEKPSSIRVQESLTTTDIDPTYTPSLKELIDESITSTPRAASAVNKRLESSTGKTIVDKKETSSTSIDRNDSNMTKPVVIGRPPPTIRKSISNVPDIASNPSGKIPPAGDKKRVATRIALPPPSAQLSSNSTAEKSPTQSATKRNS